MALQPMKGVKMVEVAQFTFTPSAGAVLADWGADVIKVEHAVTGDAQRGLRLGDRRHGRRLVPAADGAPQPGQAQHRPGAREPGGHATCSWSSSQDADVFLTNFLPGARRRLRIEVEDIRAANPDIIYVRGSGHGQRGPEAEKGGYDGSTFWCRAGQRVGGDPARQPPADQPARRRLRRLDRRHDDRRRHRRPPSSPASAPARPSVVDVSLMSVGAWAMALSLSVSAMLDMAIPPPAARRADDHRR